MGAKLAIDIYSGYDKTSPSRVMGRDKTVTVDSSVIVSPGQWKHARQQQLAA